MSDPRLNKSEPSPTYIPITPTDHTLPVPLSGTTFGACLAVWVGTGGNVSLDDLNGHTSVVFMNVPSGTMLPLQAKSINATGTTAGSIIAIY